MKESGAGGFRVLHIAQKLPGGVGAYLSEVAAYQLEALGPDRLRVLIARTERSSLPPLPDPCYHHFPTSDRSPLALTRFAWAARKAILAERPHIVHLHSTYAGLLRPIIASLSPSHRPRVVYCAHGWAFNMRWSDRRRNLFAAIERRLSPLAARVLCISQFEFDSAVRRGLPEANMRVLHNGVTASVRPGGQPPAPMPADRLNLIFIGRQDEQKGFDIAEAAMAQLTDFPVHLHVIGASVVARDGHAARDLPNVTHHGWQEREAIWRILEGADAVLVPSRWEGFGLAAIEGMRQGKPVLASHVDALPEVVRDGVTGLLFPPEDPAALASLIRSLDRQRLVEMGRHARQEYCKRFTGEQMNQRIVETYQEVLHDRVAAGHRG